MPARAASGAPAELCKHLETYAGVEVARRSPERDAPGAAAEVERFGVWLLRNFSSAVPVQRPTIVVDVAADSLPPQQVLHAATGPLVPIVARWNAPGLGEQIGIGWVMTYYEFSEEDLRRLADEEWLRRVVRGKHRAVRPAWTRSFMYEG